MKKNYKGFLSLIILLMLLIPQSTFTSLNSKKENEKKSNLPTQHISNWSFLA